MTPLEVHPEVARLHSEGLEVGEIAAELGMSRYAVRAMVNQLDPPHHGQAFLLPNASAHAGGLDGAVLDMRRDEATDRRSPDIVASLVKRGRERGKNALVEYTRNRKRGKA